RQLIDAQDDTPHALRVVVFGGEALEMSALAPWIARNSLQRTRLVNMYGITETTVHVTYHDVGADDVLERRASIVGRPLDDLQVWILDEQMQVQPPGGPSACGRTSTPVAWRRK
ncbi:MAG TPA: AMP-binding protein, partial [Holophagaceae bacterium]|nr:AMP-binding protein [Holophagaceae bacterium]